MTVTTITTLGDGNWTCPATCYEVIFECWGGGGAGAGYGGGGGGGGSYAKTTMVPSYLQKGKNFPYYVGSGGNGMGHWAEAGNFTAVQDPSGTFLAAAPSGYGGTSSSGGGPGANISPIGDVIYSGGYGAYVGDGTRGGGGGGGGGTASDGNNASGITGASAVTGGGPGGYGSNTAGGTGSSPATGYGGGGGGGGISSFYSAAGYQGKLVITYYTGTAPTVSTVNDTSRTYTEFVAGGNVTSAGSHPVFLRGVICNTTSTVDLDNYVSLGLASGGGTGSYTCTVEGLSPGVKYYFKAIAISDAGVAYGALQDCTTTAKKAPTVTKNAYLSYDYDSAYTYGEVTDYGGSTCQAGMVWGTNTTPTLTTHTNGSYTTDYSGYNGEYSSTIFNSPNGLLGGTKYYYRAYATNESGTGYSTVGSFTTYSAVAPSVQTNEVTPGSVTAGGAKVNGQHNTQNGAAVSSYGFVYNTTGNPTTSDTKIQVGTSININTSFYYVLTGLNPETTYYIRAYSTNSAGTGYGEDVAFETLYKDKTIVLLDALKTDVSSPAKLNTPIVVVEGCVIVPDAMLVSSVFEDAYMASTVLIHVPMPLESSSGCLLAPERVWGTSPSVSVLVNETLTASVSEFINPGNDAIIATSPNARVIVDNALIATVSEFIIPSTHISTTVNVVSTMNIVGYYIAPRLSITTSWTVPVSPLMQATASFPEILDIWHKIDGFMVTVYKVQEDETGASDPYIMGTTPSEEYVHYVSQEKREFKVYGVPCDCYYTMGVKAYRIVDDDIAQDGVIYSGLAQWPPVGKAPFATTDVDYTGLVDGIPATTISPNFDTDGYIIGPFKPNTTGVPSGFTGLFANKDKMGYFASGAFQTYIANDGKFYFKGNGSNYIQWNGSSLIVRGNVHATSIAASVSITSPTISSATLSFGKAYYGDSAAGYYIGESTIDIGNATSYMKFDGSDLTISGNITGAYITGAQIFGAYATFNNDITLGTDSTTRTIYFNDKGRISSSSLGNIDIAATIAVGMGVIDTDYGFGVHSGYGSYLKAPNFFQVTVDGSLVANLTSSYAAFSKPIRASYQTTEGYEATDGILTFWASPSQGGAANTRYSFYFLDGLLYYYEVV